MNKCNLYCYASCISNFSSIKVNDNQIINHYTETLHRANCYCLIYRRQYTCFDIPAPIYLRRYIGANIPDPIYQSQYTCPKMRTPLYRRQYTCPDIPAAIYLRLYTGARATEKVGPGNVNRVQRTYFGPCKSNWRNICAMRSEWE